MLHKTRGIVLHTTNYSETSVIAKVYTELFGLQSYLINGVRNKKAKVKANLLQPLSLLNLVAYHKERNGLQRVSEVSTGTTFTSIPYNIIKSSIILFLNEIVFKVIHEEEVNVNLFEFIYNSVCILDLMDDHHPNCSNFHLIFMVQLSKHLGFFPLGTYTDSTTYFNLREGVFQGLQPLAAYIENPLSEITYQLTTHTYMSTDPIRISKSERKELLQKMIEYYELHISGFSKIKSLQVLEDVMM